MRADRTSRRSHRFHLAGGALVVDAVVAPLAPFASGGSERLPADAAPALTGCGEFASWSTGWIASAQREVRVWRHERGLRLHIAEVGTFSVTAEGIAVIERDAATHDAEVAEALLGPPLVLALAMQDVWCLHASAASVDGRAVVFAGESGNGKSTVAAALNGLGEGAWRRLADDALPIRLDRRGAVALPHFPQLKLSAAEQYPADAPAAVPIAGAFVVVPSHGEGTVTIDRLTRRQAAQSLIRHTIASRLFDRPLLAAHLDFCARAAARIPVWRLGYPHRREALPQVRDAICRALSLAPADGVRDADPVDAVG